MFASRWGAEERREDESGELGRALRAVEVEGSLVFERVMVVLRWFVMARRKGEGAAKTAPR